MKHRTAPTLVLATVLALAAAAHEDDPKLLSRLPAHPGSGLRLAVPPAGMPLAEAAMPNFGMQDVQLLSWLTLADLGENASANDCWGYSSPAGREYAIIGLKHGTAWVDVSTPQNPVVVANLPGPSSLWRDVKVFGQYAYAVSEGGDGIQVFDMGAIDGGVVSLANTVTFGGNTTATHNVALDDVSGFLYRCGGGSNGLRIYDLNADPTNPAFAGSWNAKYVHDAQIVTYGSGPGAQQVAFCCAGFNGGFSATGLSIVDVTNKQNPVVLREVSWPGARYSHQVWLSEDRSYAYLNDELDENGFFPTTTHVVDVSSPASAFLAGSFTNGNEAIGHNLFVRGDRIFEANYRSGLRVFDTSADPLAPVEAAWFDTFPVNDQAKFNGLWGVFPFFDSGIVVGSDIEKGLFVWWVGPSLLSPTFAAGAPGFTDPDGESFVVSIGGLDPSAYEPGTAALHYDAGAGLVSVPLADLGGGQFQADFPPLPCGTALAYFLSAQSTNGITWYDPPLAPAALHDAVAANGVVSLANEDLESGVVGWTAGDPADDATEGLWVAVDSEGTLSQPSGNHTPDGAVCWVTGQGVPGAPDGASDVDDGTTTLISPTFDLSATTDPVVSYWRWYSNYANGTTDDVLSIELDLGAGWIAVETIGPGNDAVGGWIQHAVRVRDFAAPTSTVRLRFRASDTGGDSIVEVAIDDLEVRDYACWGLPAAYCQPKPSSNGCLPAMGALGLPGASQPGAFDAFATDVHNQKNGLLFYGYAAAALPFQGGTLCVQPPLRRTGVQISGGALPPTNDCSGELHFDFNAWIGAGLDPALVPGADVFSQYWFRDPGDALGFGAGLTDGLRFAIAP